MHHQPCDPFHQPAEGEVPMQSLARAERLVVVAMRAWAAPHRAPGQPHPDWRGVLAAAGLAPVGLIGFDLLMSVLARGARRNLDVRCCHCPGVGADEAALVDLLAALQRNDELGALGVLGDWLPGEAIGPALRGARRFAGQLLAIGLAPLALRAPCLSAPRWLH
ncbi:hypothetical protein [Falsiroseomonas selenitidurans]|uniref:Uncharacterized protein n=1 Tax=Falsiroseomonas selenitidurans TaxID=2716335 RepID=A0ABX1E8L3_9PROT|nr:hypothetical protein [Falsiroseomonas selenitidurans]NKC32112.1 hypothetical protein [Falsiroseomonas selenitidurans]